MATDTERGLVCANCGSDSGCDQTIKHKTRLIAKTVTHELKTWWPYYEAVANNEKNFELRRADRDFRVGDTLHLRMWDSRLGDGYSGAYCYRIITYILAGKDAEKFGLKPGYCVLGLR